MNPARLVARLFVPRRDEPVAFWSGRAKAPGLRSVMWENDAYNECAHHDQWKAVVRYLPARRDAVLDLGCGTGRLSEPLAGLFANYTGVDIEPMVREARRRHPRLSGSFVCSTVQDFAFPSARFDLVLSLSCLASACRRGDLERLAGPILASARPGGRVLLIEPLHRWWPLVRLCRMNPLEVIPLFARHGAVLVEWTAMHFLPVRLLLARRAFDGAPGFTRALYRVGEVVGPIVPRQFRDYQVIVLERPGVPAVERTGEPNAKAQDTGPE